MYGCMAGIIYYGAILHDNGQITIGQITSFLLYMVQLIFNFMIVAMVLGNIFKMFGASEKIIKLMRYIPNINCVGG